MERTEGRPGGAEVNRRPYGGGGAQRSGNPFRSSRPINLEGPISKDGCSCSPSLFVHICNRRECDEESSMEGLLKEAM